MNYLPPPADEPVVVRPGEPEKGYRIPPPPVPFQEPVLDMGHTDTSDLLAIDGATTASVDWSRWFPAEPDAVFETNIQTAVNAAVAAERARIKQLLHHRAATVDYTSDDQAHGYAQGLYDAVGIMYYKDPAGHPELTPSGERDPWACDQCGADFGPTRLPVARLGHNGTRHLLACADCAPAEQAEPAPHIPRRGAAVETWLDHECESQAKFGTHAGWKVLDRLIEEYQAHADAGVPLDQELPPGTSDQDGMDEQASIHLPEDV